MAVFDIVWLFAKTLSPPTPGTRITKLKSFSSSPPLRGPNTRMLLGSRCLPPTRASGCGEVRSGVAAPGRAAFVQEPAQRSFAGNSRRGIATSASRNVAYRLCRTTLVPILTRFSCSVVGPPSAGIMSLVGQQRTSSAMPNYVCFRG